jgi:hypothetical protein
MVKSHRSNVSIECSAYEWQIYQLNNRSHAFATISNGRKFS